MSGGDFVDLHTHTIFSDGVLLPAELVQRARAKGCRGIAITDHADSSNLESILAGLNRFVDELGSEWEMEVLAGVELTHVPPRKIGSLADRARALGARWVVVHGETLVEPVEPGTNRAAIEAGVDLLAHPGLITREEVSLAARAGVFLEISTRQGHSLSNGWVARCAREMGARLLLNSDTHAPRDMLDAQRRSRYALGAGLSHEELEEMWNNAAQVLGRLSR